MKFIVFFLSLIVILGFAGLTYLSLSSGFHFREANAFPKVEWQKPKIIFIRDHKGIFHCIDSSKVTGLVFTGNRYKIWMNYREMELTQSTFCKVVKAKYGVEASCSMGE
jgi:hypothetical protein